MMTRLFSMVLIVGLMAAPTALYAQPKSKDSDEGPPPLQITNPESRRAVRVPAASGKRAITLSDTQPQAGGGPLSTEQLHQLLKSMGYEDATLEASGDIGIAVDTWKFWARRSPDGGTIWLLAALSKIENVAQAPSDKLLGILEANNTTDGQIVYFSSHQWLNLQKAIPNNNITPGLMLKTLNAFTKMMGRTQPLWKQENFPK